MVPYRDRDRDRERPPSRNTEDYRRNGYRDREYGRYDRPRSRHGEHLLSTYSIWSSMCLSENKLTLRNEHFFIFWITRDIKNVFNEKETFSTWLP